MKARLITLVLIALFIALGGCGGKEAHFNSPSEAGATNTVYITLYGHKYHRAGCRYLAENSIPMSIEEAKKSGYGPCGACDPPQ
ncbi:MAG: hypothetical protein AB1426_04700 [Bacillota bacterium]